MTRPLPTPQKVRFAIFPFDGFTTVAIEIINNRAQSDRCKMQMVFRSARWCWEFLGTAWSNKSDANLPEGDTKLPRGDNP